MKREPNQAVERMTSTLPNPFPGLRPFRIEEAALFFGRDRDIDLAVRMLSTRGVITVAGRSGCGKRSFVRAGLLPALHCTLYGGSPLQLAPVIFRPGSDPIRNLALAITQAREEYGSDALVACEASLRSRPTALVDLAHADTQTGAPLHVVVVDQFEEVFRGSSTGESSTQFIHLILSASEQSTNQLKVVLILRSDFFGEVDRFAGLTEAISETLLLLPRLTPAQISDAILGPLKKAGGDIEAGLVSDMIDDVTGLPDELTLLQHALRTCWEVASREYSNDRVLITRSHYEFVGGVAGSLNHSAEAVFSELRPDQRRICESMFRALATRDERGYFLRRPLTLGAVASIAAAPLPEVLTIAAIFSKQNFLTPSVDMVAVTEHTVLDVSLEAVLRNWRRLSHWIDDEHKLAEEYHTLIFLARQWEIGQAGLLRGGVEIERATAFRENHMVSSEWADLYASRADFQAVMHYLSASIDSVTKGRLGRVSKIGGSNLPARRKIFICYRREYDSYAAHTIFNQLAPAFGKSNVFYDIRSIPAGVDFSAYILERIRVCAVLLAVIGNHSLDARFGDGPRKGELRIDDPMDLVRVEIETAFRLGVRVIPVLVGTRKMPEKSELPASLESLANAQAMELPPGVEFDNRLERLVGEIREAIPHQAVVDKFSAWFRSVVAVGRH
jgi:hypothetical protein